MGLLTTGVAGLGGQRVRADPGVGVRQGERHAGRPDIGSKLLTAAVWIGAVIMLVPVVWMGLTSLKPQSEILQQVPTFLPHHITFDAYTTVLNDPDNPLLTYFANSVIVAGSITVAVLFTSTLAGYVFAKFRFFGRGLIFVLVLSSLMVPAQAIVIPLYLTVRAAGLFNTLWALILPNMVSGFGVYMMKQYIEGLPTSVIEAARIDGASEFAIYRRIILPQVRPALAALGIFTFKWMWNDYLWPLFAINDTAHSTLGLGVAQYASGQHGTEYNLTLAVATLSALPLIVVFVVFQKQFVEGIAISGLKG